MLVGRASRGFDAAASPLIVAGVGTHLSDVFDLGLQVPVSWGYFFKNGNGAAVNDASNHYQGIQAEGLVFLRVNLHLL